MEMGQIQKQKTVRKENEEEEGRHVEVGWKKKIQCEPCFSLQRIKTRRFLWFIEFTSAHRTF